ncbi:hypothetical protein MPRM_27170 [Mycobacterium parmense]|uniref:Uncharacterized protein n=1 Tax=Mycobacterium parmense TaxID=185642 RepID=A0A7I7YU76_9MYCO|nr:hypothetical protein MPRM_27170 [Mycobacterium parmense]
MFAAPADADRLDPFPWTPYDRQFVANVDAYTTTHVHRIYDPSEADDSSPHGYLRTPVTNYKLGSPVSLARDTCKIINGPITKEFDDQHWFTMPAWDNGVPEGAWVTKQAIAWYCPQYSSLEYW